MDSVEVEGLTCALVDIDSTTGREQEVGAWLSRFLRDRGYRVTEQPVADGRFNVFAQLDGPPQVVFSTHFDCVPPLRLTG
jgi:acetylornithine deacetylase/succinyl-diaminopimelate desuccinylase-like protein